MATLLETLYWTADPSAIYSLIFGGSGSKYRDITAAESHDANSATYVGTTCSGDGLDPGADQLDITGAITTSVTTDTITSVKLICSGVSTGSGDCGVTALLDSAPYGFTFALPHSYGPLTLELTTDPVLGGAWTAARINAKTFGLKLENNTIDAFGVQDTQLAEFKVEVWGDAPAPPPSSGVKVVGVPYGKRWWSS